MNRAGRRPLRLFWPSAIVAILAAAALVGLMWTWSADVDAQAQVHEEALLTKGLHGRVGELERLVQPNIVWDEAVVHLDNRFDPAWARENIGVYLTQIADLSASAVLSSEDKPLLTMAGQEVRVPDAMSAYLDSARPLVARVRALEAARRARGGHRIAEQSLSARQLVASDFVLVDGEPMLASASVVQPDFGKATPRGPRAPVVLTFAPVDAMVGLLAERYMLEGVHASLGDTTDEKAEAHVVVTTADRRTLFTIDWNPARPGTALRDRALPPVALAIAGLLALTLLLYHRQRRTARDLIVSEAQASHAALHDALTGLANRTRFLQRLDELAANHRRRTDGGGACAVICIRVQRYKEVNDAYGHHCGDEFIAEAARRLSALSRSEDVVARIANDEFAVLLPRADGKDAFAWGQRAAAALQGAVDLSAGTFPLTAALGATVVDPCGIEPAEALRQADLALARATRDAAPSAVFFEPEMDANLKLRRELEADLRRALDDGDLHLVYQPQAQRSRIVGLEALARWNHPTRGPISPGYFVPLAEEAGLAHALTEFALRTAFMDGRRWPGMRIAVNVSALDVTSQDFVDRVEALLEETGASAGQFELEITEGVLLADNMRVQDSLARLRRLGFSLALDDFGTGYSSLGYLRQYPVDKIKIDRAFVCNLGHDTEAEALVRAIVRMARALGLSILAEGVETPEQRKILGAAGCNLIQGYLISPGVGADEIDALLADTARAA